MSFLSSGRMVAAAARGALVFGAIMLAAPAAHAITLVVDGAAGTDYDSVGDGWFFAGPSQPPPDGTGDAGNQALAVGLKAGALELRALAEFPLSGLAGYTAAEVTSATLTVTIDDVIGTFGPGAEFDGTASSPFAAYSYPANGTVTTADFSPAGLASLGTITPGVVTDATLAVSGPLAFDLDVTAAVQAFLTGGETHLGVLLGTLDSPTATSLDGVLPYLTIVITPEAPPVYSSAELKCQAGIAKASAGLAATAQKSLAKCLDTVLKTVAGGAPAGDATEACAKLLDIGEPKSAVAKAKAKAADAIVKACGALVPADVDSPCNGSAVTIADTASCLVAATTASVEAMIDDRYAKGCVLLGAVGLDGAYPGVCAP